jgi:hypothetical protein
MIDDVTPLVKQYSGICFPVHVDREANGILSTLGSFPETPVFTVAEFHDGEKRESYAEKHPQLKEMITVIGSDAHYLWDIRDKEYWFDLDDEPYSSDLVRHRLFQTLGGKTE